MERIRVQLFLRLWDQIAALERETDHGLAKRLGISTGSPTFWRNGRTKAVSPRLIRALESKIGYKIQLGPSGKDWIVKKSGSSVGLEDEAVSSMESWKGEKCPVISGARLKAGKVHFEFSGDYAMPAWLAGRGNSYWYRVEDTTMSPRFGKGDLVFVRKVDEVVSGDYALVCLKPAARLLIRRVHLNEGMYILSALDEESETILARKEQILFCAPILITKYHATDRETYTPKD